MASQAVPCFFFGGAIVHYRRDRVGGQARSELFEGSILWQACNGLSARLSSDRIHDSIGFAKSIGDQRGDCFQRSAFIGTAGAQYQFTADRSFQRKDRHDSFAIGFLASFLQRDVTGKTLGNIDQLGGGASMDTETVDDLDLSFCHGVCGSGLLGEGYVAG